MYVETILKLAFLSQMALVGSNGYLINELRKERQQSQKLYRSTMFLLDVLAKNADNFEFTEFERIALTELGVMEGQNASE